jgi:hypothetical protein
MHDLYEKICAVAAIGQATPQELATLRDHLQGCAKCRQGYSEFTNIAAQPYIENLRRQFISPQEAALLPNADELRDRFLRRAREQGIRSAKTIRAEPPYSAGIFWNLLRRPSPNAPAVWRAVAVLALILLPSAYEVGRWAATTPTSQVFDHSVHSSKVPLSVETSQKHGPETSDLHLQIASLKEDLRVKDQEVKSLTERLRVSSENAANLLSAGAQLELSHRELKSQLREGDRLIQQHAHDEELLLGNIGELKTALNAAQASYVADEIKIRGLTEEVVSKSAAAERNAELLERDRDIRDLMTARNLHIHDVSDADVKGKTKSAFGRIFYTEGKSLVFYAYDLKEATPTNASYHYRVWGSQAAEKKVTSLGVFYSDDKALRRWVFKCHDARVLGQIDSVFVTLEPARSDSPYPKGQKLLDAYLGGVANHP